MDTRTNNRFERRKQRTRDQLKVAAMELILEKGYDEVTVQDITDRADLGRGTFYVHFNDKEDIVWQAVRESFDAIQADLVQRYAGESSPRLEYLTWIRMFESAAEERTLFLVMLGGKGSAVLTERIQDYLAQVVVQGMDDGRFYPTIDAPPMVAAQFVVGALVRCIAWWLMTPNDYTPADMAGHFYRMMFQSDPPL